MLSDLYELPISTASPTAQEAYRQGCDLLLTMYPGATEEFDRAIVADPGFALAHVARARSRQLTGDIVSARASQATAESLAGSVSKRERSHIAIFQLIFAGQADAALAMIRTHLDEWPRDAVVLSTTANQTGLIGMSGRSGREQELVVFLDGLATHYGEDPWFNAHYAMALSETSQQAAARPRIERSMHQNPRNAFGAHALAHLYYEDSEPKSAIQFMHSWLPAYPRDGLLHGHLHWHLAIFELAVGNWADGFRLYDEAFASKDYQGLPLLKVVDATSFLWRAELAGHPHDAARWLEMQEFAQQMFQHSGFVMVDWHVALANAATGDGKALNARVQEMEDMLRDGRYPAGPGVPAITRAFAAFQRQDFTTTIAEIEPMLAERERIGGSRAQVDLVEFTLLKAYLNAGRPEDARRLLSTRRPGPTNIPVAGLSAVF